MVMRAQDSAEQWYSSRARSLLDQARATVEIDHVSVRPFKASAGRNGRGEV